jgi:hypothetical protein
VLELFSSALHPVVNLVSIAALDFGSREIFAPTPAESPATPEVCMTFYALPLQTTLACKCNSLLFKPI